MEFINEFGQFLDDEEEKFDEIKMVANKAKEIMDNLGKDAFDDDVYVELAKMFGDEWLGEVLQDVIKYLGVEDRQTY